MNEVSDAEAHAALRTFLTWIGDDPDRQGLLATPERVMKAWRQSWGASYELEERDLIEQLRVFDDEHSRSYNSMVMTRNIQVHSMCEHHMAPFFGTATLAYIPPQPLAGVVGLSKLARIVNFYARRLQVQERLTEQIAGFVFKHIAREVTGCGVIIRAKHLCMVTRGVQEPESETITSALRGCFFTQQSTRDEFFRLAR